MKTFQSRHAQLPGSSYDEISPHARKLHHIIEKRTKRQAYVRSTYFRRGKRGDKVFINLYWEDLAKKSRKKKTERLKLYSAAIDLLIHSPFESEVVVSEAAPNLIYHRFYGVTRDNIRYCVQVKQDMRTGRLDFMSAFRRNVP